MDMLKGCCGCPHHWVVKILAVLVWVSGVLFFWTSLRGVAVWGFESLYYAWTTVVLSLLILSSRVCDCCVFGRGGWWKTGETDKTDHHEMCTHQPDCKCGDCPRCM